MSHQVAVATTVSGLCVLYEVCNLGEETLFTVKTGYVYWEVRVDSEETGEHRPCNLSQ